MGFENSRGNGSPCCPSLLPSYSPPVPLSARYHSRPVLGRSPLGAPRCGSRALVWLTARGARVADSPWGPNPGLAMTIMDEEEEVGAPGRESGSSDPATSCDAHREHGPKKGCTLCHALRLQAVARNKLPTLDPRWGVPLSAVPDPKQSLALATWFSVRATPGRETVVGCAACAASGKAGRTGGRWVCTTFTAASTSMRLSSLRKHHDPQHTSITL